MRELERTAYGPVTLGALIDALERLQLDPEGKPRGVRYDFGGLLPTKLDSYRGYYSELALGFEDWDARQRRTDTDPTVAELLSMLKGADGSTYTGWKGGDYVMDRNTAIFVANRGEASSCGIVDIFVESYQVILMTDHFG